MVKLSAEYISQLSQFKIMTSLHSRLIITMVQYVFSNLIVTIVDPLFLSLVPHKRLYNLPFSPFTFLEFFFFSFSISAAALGGIRIRKLELLFNRVEILP